MNEMRIAFVMASALAGLYALPAMAQQPNVDCKKAETQSDMTYCAQVDADKADKALNTQYQATRKKLKDWDTAAIKELKGADDSLLKAQRAWVAFRDAHCASWGFQAHGGTLEPMLVAACQADMSRKRTAELKALAENM